MGLVSKELQHTSESLLDTLALQEGLLRPTPTMSKLMWERNRVIASVLESPAEPGKHEAEIQELNHAFLVQIEAIARGVGRNTTTVSNAVLLETNGVAERRQELLDEDRGADLLLILSLVALGLLILPLLTALLAYVVCCRKSNKVRRVDLSAAGQRECRLLVSGE